MGSTKCGIIITILMLLKTSEVVAQTLLVPKGQRKIQGTYLYTSFHKKTKGSKSGKSKKKEKKCSKKKGKKGCDDSGDDYWEFFAPAGTPSASEPRPWSSPSSAVEAPTGSVDTSQPTPTYGNAIPTASPINPPATGVDANPTASPIHPPTTGVDANPTALPIHPPTTGVEDSGQSRPTPGSPVKPPTGSPVTSTNPPSSSTDPGTSGASEPLPTKPDILTEQAGSGDDTGVLSACATHLPETSANAEIRVLAFEYAMLVVPETGFPYIESMVQKVEERLHEVLAEELLQCGFSTNASVQRLSGEQDEFDFLSISSLPKDFITSDDCADDETRDNTDCVVIAGIFTIEFLKGGLFDDLLFSLTRLMKELMPPNVRRELAENLSVANIDPKLKGLVFRSFITPFDDTAGVDNESEQANDGDSLKSRGAIAGAAIVGTAAAVAIVVGYLSTQRRHCTRTHYKDSETTTIGIEPRPSDSFSTHSHCSALPIFYGAHECGSYDMSVYTTTKPEPSEYVGSNNGNSDCENTHISIPCDVTSKMYDKSVHTTTGLEHSGCGDSENGDDGEKTHNSIPCDVTSKMYDMSVYTTTGLEHSGCGDSENGNDGEKTHNSIPCDVTSKMYDKSVYTTTGLEHSGCGGSENGNDGEKTHNSIQIELSSEMYDMSVFNTTLLEPSERGGSENGNNDCEKTNSYSFPFDWKSCRKMLFYPNSIDLDEEIV